MGVGSACFAVLFGLSRLESQENINFLRSHEFPEDLFSGVRKRVVSKRVVSKRVVLRDAPPYQEVLQKVLSCNAPLAEESYDF